MRRERREDAIALLQQRWAATFKFDLSVESWDTLLDQHEPGTILEAIKLAKDCVDPLPERAYQYFLKKLRHTADKYEVRSISNN